jgi:hypothetical protein
MAQERQKAIVDQSHHPNTSAGSWRNSRPACSGEEIDFGQVRKVTESIGKEGSL